MTQISYWNLDRLLHASDVYLLPFAKFMKVSEQLKYFCLLKDRFMWVKVPFE